MYPKICQNCIKKGEMVNRVCLTGEVIYKNGRGGQSLLHTFHSLRSTLVNLHVRPACLFGVLME